jgi:hypothetical protein
MLWLESFHGFNQSVITFYARWEQSKQKSSSRGEFDLDRVRLPGGRDPVSGYLYR